MNPTMCSTREVRGPEWEFAEGSLSVVVSIEDTLYLATEPDALEGMPRKHRAVARALLTHALEQLDRTEPTLGLTARSEP